MAFVFLVSLMIFWGVSTFHQTAIISAKVKLDLERSGLWPTLKSLDGIHLRKVLI